MESEKEPSWENGDFDDMKQRSWEFNDDGELVVDEDGNAVLFDEYSEAKFEAHKDNVEFTKGVNSFAGDTLETAATANLEGSFEGASTIADYVNNNPMLIEKETEFFEGMGETMVELSGQTTDFDRITMEQEIFLESTAVDLDEPAPEIEPYEGHQEFDNLENGEQNQFSPEQWEAYGNIDDSTESFTDDDTIDSIDRIDAIGERSAEDFEAFESGEQNQFSPGQWEAYGNIDDSTESFTDDDTIDSIDRIDAIGEQSAEDFEAFESGEQNQFSPGQWEAYGNIDDPTESLATEGTTDFDHLEPSDQAEQPSLSDEYKDIETPTTDTAYNDTEEKPASVDKNLETQTPEPPPEPPEIR
jgi:hypothetical protein